MMLANLVFHPENFTAWIVVGLVVGWLATKVMGEANYGLVGDLILGVAGALVAAIAVSIFVAGEPEFWVPAVVAFVGACIVIVSGRALARRQSD